MGFSSDYYSRFGFGPFTPGFVSIPYGDADALEAAITPNTVGFLVEPIQGEAGVVVPPDGFYARALEICRGHNVLMINDEIQTGLGRTGRLFCADWEADRGDIMIVGKALGGGVFPVSGILANSEIMDVFNPGDHGSTFGGNPLGAAVGMAALDVIRDERLAERSNELGAWFKGELEAIDSPHVDHVRGRGLFIGVVVRDASGTGASVLRGAAGARDPRQGDARAGDPLRAAAHDREGESGMGAGKHRRGAGGRGGRRRLSRAFGRGPPDGASSPSPAARPGSTGPGNSTPRAGRSSEKPHATKPPVAVSTVRQRENRSGPGDPASVTEPQLIERLRDGDEKAARLLYDAHVDRVFRICYRYAGEDDLAQDFTQETFVRAFTKIDTFPRGVGVRDVAGVDRDHGVAERTAQGEALPRPRDGVARGHAGDGRGTPDRARRQGSASPGDR